MNCCGTCNCHKRSNELGEWICDNPESENYGLETEYNDDCYDYVGEEDE